MDTSVGRAAGLAAEPRSEACRLALQAIRDYPHRLAVSDAWKEEWKRHRSEYSNGWLTRMYGRRLVSVNPRLNKVVGNLPRLLDSVLTTPAAKEAVAKDAFLLQLALASDRAVISLDRALLEHLRVPRRLPANIGQVMWVDPEIDTDASDWLMAGAEHDEHRTIDAKRAELK